MADLPIGPALPMDSTMNNQIARFNEIIDRIESRCMATDGPVTPTLHEMRESELAEIWRLLTSIRDTAAGKSTGGGT